MRDKEAIVNEDFNFDEFIAFSPEAVEAHDNVNNFTAFQCPKCEFVDFSRLDVATEEEMTPTTPQPNYIEVVVYVCSLCYGQHSSVDDLRSHMIDFHKCKAIEPEKKTDKLTIETKKVELPSKNMKISEQVSKENNLNPLALHPVPFKDFKLILRRNLVQKCTLSGCCYKFESDEKRKVHLKCHKDGSILEFKCSECGISVENWRRCSAHLWKTHRLPVGLLQCPLCAYVSSSSVRVWRHMQTHPDWKTKVLKSIKSKNEEDKPPPAPRTKYYAEKSCDICSRKFVNGKTLSKHVKSVHNKIKPFICNVCGLKTTRKSVLAIHMRQHTGEKPLQCKVCKFRTRDPSTLKTHEMRHENNRRQKCPACEKSFIQTAAFKCHVRKNHPEEYKKIACEICNYVTINAKKLESHMEDHKKGLIVNNEDSLDTSRGCSLKTRSKFNAHGTHLGNAEISSDCFMPLESVDSIPHVPAVDTGGVTIPAPAHSEDTQFPTFLNN